MCHSIETTTTKKPFQRLPTSIVPIHYALDYSVIDLENFRFEGTEVITLQVKESTSVITCHAVDLWIRNVTLSCASDPLNNNHNPLTEISYSTEDQTVSMTFAQPLTVSNSHLTLSLSFFGILNDELRGLYRSKYTSALTGHTKYMAVSQYEACDARRAFVCWDEPAVKATFALKVTAPADLRVISNSRVTSSCATPGVKKSTTWSFAPTPKMSSYLLALVIGEFDYISEVLEVPDSGQKINVGVYTPVGVSHQGSFALECAVKALTFFTEKFNFAYPLDKCDMLAVPDFAAGAMENWGCITYRETRLLIDVHQSSLQQKTAVARTICHELAHQWFGNLVTMEWWTGLWLNEGFARFMEFEAVNAIFPQWHVWEQFVQEITQSSAMKRDAMHSTHPIEVEVGHPDEVDQIFDVISYAKGASIIRMLYHYLGPEAFYRGIQHYIRTFQYDNATTLDLWQALEAANDGVALVKMMNSWTKQEGFPVVSLTDDGHARQTRFIQHPSSKGQLAESTPLCWSIPLSISWNGHETLDLGFFRDPECTRDALVVSSSDDDRKWFILNPDQKGFYLVNYSSRQWRVLCQHITTCSVLDRVTLLCQAFMLLRQGTLNLDIVFELCLAVSQDRHYLVWRVMSEHLGFYLSLLGSHPELQSRLRHWIATLYETGPYIYLLQNQQEQEDPMRPLFEQNILSMLRRTKPELIEESFKTQFDAAYGKSKDSSTNISADLRRCIFQCLAKQHDKSIYPTLLHLASSSAFIEERLDVYAALGLCPSSRRETLSWALENVRHQDIQYVFGSVASSDVEGTNIAWNFVVEHWTNVFSQAFVPYITGRIVLSIMQHFTTLEELEKVQAFMKDKVHDSYRLLYVQVVEAIQTKAFVLAKDLQALDKFLKSFE